MTNSHRLILIRLIMWCHKKSIETLANVLDILFIICTQVVTEYATVAIIDGNGSFSAEKKPIEAAAGPHAVANNKFYLLAQMISR